MSERSLEDDLFGGEDVPPEAADPAEKPGEQEQAGGGEDPTPSDPEKSSEGEGGSEGDPEKSSEGQGGDQGGDPDADKAKDQQKDEDKFVPKKALDSVKRVNRDLKARLKRLEEAENERQQRAAQANMPDPKTQPVEYARFQQEQNAAIALNEKLNQSEYRARKGYGDDTVNEAFEWMNDQMAADTTGKLRQELLSHVDPYDFAVEKYKAAQEAQKGGQASAGAEDPEYQAFLAWKASQQGGQPAAAPQPSAEKPKAPTSLAQRPSASGPAKVVETKDPFDAEFGR